MGDPHLGWLPVLVVMATALAGAACSDGDGGSSGGGSAGSSTGGTGNGGSSSGGSASVESSKAGLQLSLHSPTPPNPNTECFPAGMTAIGDPAPALDPLDPGEPVSGGDPEVTVACSVVGADTFSVEAVIARDSFRFKIDNGTVDATAGTGVFKLLVETEEAGDIVSEAAAPCTFDVSEPPLEIGEGKLFATFECPVLWNHATATDTACGASGVLALELCQDE